MSEPSRPSCCWCLHLLGETPPVAVAVAAESAGRPTANRSSPSAGTIEYQDTVAHWLVLVLLHGLMMDNSLWDEVIAGLAAGHRCVAPTLPLGRTSPPWIPALTCPLPG